MWMRWFIVTTTTTVFEIPLLVKSERGVGNIHKSCLLLSQSSSLLMHVLADIFKLNSISGSDKGSLLLLVGFNLKYFNNTIYVFALTNTAYFLRRKFLTKNFGDSLAIDQNFLLTKFCHTVWQFRSHKVIVTWLYTKVHCLKGNHIGRCFCNKSHFNRCTLVQNW